MLYSFPPEISVAVDMNKFRLELTTNRFLVSGSLLIISGKHFQ